jgi:hypothetical protein
VISRLPNITLQRPGDKRPPLSLRVTQKWRISATGKRVRIFHTLRDTTARDTTRVSEVTFRSQSNGARPSGGRRFIATAECRRLTTVSATKSK